MSDMHVLGGDDKGGYRVAMHFPVPAGNNLAEIPWRDAVKAGNPTTVLPVGTEAWEILDAEKLLIEDGAVFEHVVAVNLEPGRDTTAKVSKALQRAYGRAKTEVRDTMSRRLRWFGLTEDEA